MPTCSCLLGQAVQSIVQLVYIPCCCQPSVEPSSTHVPSLLTAKHASCSSPSLHLFIPRTPTSIQYKVAIYMNKLHLVVSLPALICLAGCRGRAEGGWAYQGQVPEGHSLLYSLINARRKDDSQPLSDLHICAQAFTFVLAGHSTHLLLCSCHCTPFPGITLFSGQCRNRGLTEAWFQSLFGRVLAVHLNSLLCTVLALCGSIPCGNPCSSECMLLGHSTHS